MLNLVWQLELVIMNKVFRRFVSVLVILLLAVSVFSVDDVLVTRYLNAANEQYSTGNFEKAFSYINTVLSSFKEEAIPDNVEVLSETIYYAYLVKIKDTKNMTAFKEVKEKLLEYPYLSSDRITRTIKIINTYEAQDIAWGADPTAKPASAGGSASGNNNPVLYSTLELQIALEAVKQDTARQTADQVQKANDNFQNELLETQKKAYESALTQAKEATSSNNKIIAFSLIILAGIIFIVFILVLVSIIVNMRASKNQNEKFVETLKMVSQMARLPENTAALEALPPIYGNNGPMRMIGSTALETGLPPAPTSEADKLALNELAKKCKEIGLQIDEVTGRKNNSKNVSEMVYKIVMEMGVSNYEATILFSISMVYDIGFLEVDRKLLRLETLTEEQKHDIRNHVKQGLAQLSFVPEVYTSAFADGVLMHHENMDGSGYPEGVSGSMIPFIARLIHVAESFVALISRRNYRDIYDKESAVEELRKKPGLYDQKIVDILEQII